MPSREVDRDRLRAYMGRMIGHMTGGAICFSIWLGDELGLYRSLADAGPCTADRLAERTGCQPRLVREWLNANAAAGLLEHSADGDTYAISPEGVAALADETSPVFVARGMNTFGSMYLDLERVKDAFRGGGDLPWAAHDPHLFVGTEWLFRTGYRAHLASKWIPALDGVEATLRAGGTVADVGCGHGAPAIEIARAYEDARVFGFDSHPPSIEIATARARAAGVGDRVTFEVADATTYDGTFDLICFFDCLHDMGDPVGAARHAHRHLTSNGRVMLVEPFALDGLDENLADNPMAALFYVASSAICTPNSLSQPGRHGLGAQAGEAVLREVLTEAGFSSMRRAAETTMNLILEARP